MLVNDYDRHVGGKPVLALQDEKGRVMAQTGQDFSRAALGDKTLEIRLEVPKACGKCVLIATGRQAGTGETTVSRRWVTVRAGSS